jgi:hypothetical protein
MIGAPGALAEIESRVCEVPSFEFPQAVYFLVQGTEIVYVKKSGGEIFLLFLDFFSVF